MFKTVGQIKTGQYFGERALLSLEDRAATVVCSTPCKFVTLSKLDYNIVLKVIQKQEMKEMVLFLRNFSIFEKIRNY